MFPSKLNTALRFVLTLVAIGGAGVGAYYLHAQAPAAQPENSAQRPKESAPNQPAAKAPEKAADTLTTLMQERLKLAQQDVEVCKKLYQSGRADFDAFAIASKSLLKAELELMTKKADRIAAQERYIKMLEGCVELARARHQAARATESEILRAQYLLVDAKIDLEREKTEVLPQKGEADGKKAEQPRQGLPKIVATSPKAKDVVITQPYVCQIRAQRHIIVRASAHGYLNEISVKEGQAVKQDDVMFRIEPTLYRAKFDAELAEVKSAEIEFNVSKKLFDQKVVSTDEVALHQAKLDKARAKAKLAEAELNLTIVRAPFDGIVDRAHEQLGSLVKEGDVLTTLTDNRVMSAYFNMPEARYLEYMAGSPGEKENQKIELVLANNTPFPRAGKIGAIEANFNNKTGNIPFRADFENPNGLLRHGQTGNVLIRHTLNNAIVIPQRATFEVLDKRYVYVVDKGGVAHQREIVVQDELDDIFVIKNGLDVNDKIVLEGIRQVRDGEKVEFEYRRPEEVMANPKNSIEK